MEMKVNIPNNPYNIIIQRGIFDTALNEVKKVFKGNKIFIVTDENVDKFYGERILNNLKDENIHLKKMILKPGEETKSIKNLELIYKEMALFNISRSDLLIALGGGVIGDISGFAASTFLRGIPFIQIPTTILAQVDSSIGGKVAVNLDSGKNLVGSFYQPKLVLIDPNFLKTLPIRNVNDGLSEVIKHGCIKDLDLFNKLSSFKDYDELFTGIENIIYTNCDIKRKVVEKDERDIGERMVLNFGHTIGHGIERYFNYEKYTHGEAVAIGMYKITKISEDMGLTKLGTKEKIKEVLLKYSLPTECEIDDKERLMESILLDKKSSSKNINLIFLKDIGDSFMHNIKKEDLSKIIKRMW